MIVLYWDFDGTLVYSGSLWSFSAYRTLKKIDPASPASFSQIRSLMAHGFPWHTPEEDHSMHIGEQWWKLMNRHFYGIYRTLGESEEVSRRASEQMRKTIMDIKNYTLYDDTIPTLRLLRERGCRHVLLSNNYPELRQITDQLGLTEYFDELVISGCVGFDKPRQEIFELAKRRYPSADMHIMIGDNSVADIVGGKNAGMKTILAHKGFDERADACVKYLADIPAVLDSLSDGNR